VGPPHPASLALVGDRTGARRVVVDPVPGPRPTCPVRGASGGPGGLGPPAGAPPTRTPSSAHARLRGGEAWEPLTQTPATSHATFLTSSLAVPSPPACPGVGGEESPPPGSRPAASRQLRHRTVIAQSDAVLMGKPRFCASAPVTHSQSAGLWCPPAGTRGPLGSGKDVVMGQALAVGPPPTLEEDPWPHQGTLLTA
jgi:hypothetical protein